MIGRRGGSRKKKRNNSRNHWKRPEQADENKISNDTYDIDTATKTVEHSENLQSLDAGEATRTLNNEGKEIIGITSDSEVSTDKAKRVQTLTEKSKDISCAVNDGEAFSNKFHNEQSFIDEEKVSSDEIKEYGKSLDKAEGEELLKDISDNSGATNYSQESSQKEGYSKAIEAAEREMDTVNYCGNCPSKSPHLETLNEKENKRFLPDEENERSDEKNKDNNIQSLNKERISFNDSTPMSHLHDDLPSSLELGCRPAVDNPATFVMLICEDLKEDDQSLSLKIDESVRNDEETEETNTNEENRTQYFSKSLDLDNALDQPSPCAMSVCEKIRENEQNQYSAMDENEEEIKRTDANEENIFDSLPHLSYSSNASAQQNSTVISAREYLEENDPNLYFDTDEGEESDEETEETIAREEKTTDCLPNLLKSSYARPTGVALSETKENDIEMTANEENIIYSLPNAVDSGSTTDQPTTHSISVCEYLTKKDRNLFLEMNESEEYEDETEETNTNSDKISAGSPNSLESSNTLPHQNKCDIPARAYREENDRKLYAEIGDSEENDEEMTQTNANEVNITDLLPDSLDSGSIFIQKNSTVISVCEYVEENDQHMCNDMDETLENDDENQEANTHVPDSLKPSNSCSDPMTETQQNGRETYLENITDSLHNASCSRPAMDQSNTFVMSVCEYLHDDEQHLFLEMIEGEETETTNSNEEMFPDCVPRLFESSHTFAQENKHESPVCEYLEESDQKLYSKMERGKENDEETGEESDEKTEEANLHEENRIHCLSNSLEASNTIGQAAVYAISVAEFLKENDQHLNSQTDENEDNDEEMKEIISNQENIFDVLPTSSENTFARKDSAPISACEYLEESDRNVYSDMGEREENEEESQEQHREINTHEEQTNDCLPNFLKQSHAFARQTRNAITETQGHDVETIAADRPIDRFPNASSSTGKVDQPNTCAMSMCDYDQTLFSEILESKEDADETEESNADQETSTDCLSRSSEYVDTFAEQTKNRIPVCKYLEDKDQNKCFEIEESEENEEATEQVYVNEETKDCYLPNSLDLGNTFDQAYTYDITVCEYLKEKELNLYSETGESEDNDEEMKETNAKEETISDCLPNSLESGNIPAQQQSTALSASDFLEDQILYFYTGENEENDKVMHEETAKEENITDCLPDSKRLGKMFDQPTIDAMSEKSENDEQTSAKEGNLSGSLSSSSELCDTYAKQNTNVISVSEYLEQNDQVLYSETDESEGGENVSDCLYSLLESCNDVAQHVENAKSVFEYPGESDENQRFEMKENEENDEQMNENEERRQMKTRDGKSLHWDDTCIKELNQMSHDSYVLPLESDSFQKCHQQITTDNSTCDYLRQTDGTPNLNISELSENRNAEVGNDEDQGKQDCNDIYVEIIRYEDSNLLQKTQENADSEMLVDNSNSTYELKHMKESSVKPEIPECLPDLPDSVIAYSQHRMHTKQDVLGLDPNEQNQVSEFDREIDNRAEGIEENWTTKKISSNTSSEQNILMLPASTNLQNESGSLSEVNDEHDNNGEEMYKVDEASKDLENLECKSSSVLELVPTPQTPKHFVDSSADWSCDSQLQTTTLEQVFAGEKLTPEFSYETENDCIAKVTENLPDEQEIFSLVNREYEKSDEAFCENGEKKKSWLTRDIEAPTHRHAMFEHSGYTVVDQTPNCLYDSPERVNHSAAVDASLTPEVEQQVSGDSRASVRIPSYDVMTVAEYLLEPDPMNNSEDNDDIDCDWSSNYEKATTQKENPEEKTSERDYVAENKSLEGCQKEDDKVPGNSEVYATENDDYETEEAAETSFLSKSEDDTDPDECESSRHSSSTETSNDEEEISEGIQQHMYATKKSLVQKKLPDKGYNRLTQSVCELFLVLAGLLLIVCISLCIIIIMYRSQFCFSYVLGPPPT